MGVAQANNPDSRSPNKISGAYWMRTRSLLTFALLPLSWIYQWVVFLRRQVFRLLANPGPSVPIIVVGNISLGGSGKTPMVQYLAALLQKNGWQPGIVSRGYGSTASRAGFVGVVDADQPGRFGDEPCLLAEITGVPVVIGAKRVAAVQSLLQNAPQTTVIISDDGLQHYAMRRALEIIVIDHHQLGNRCLLPAGPLREPLTRLDSADALIWHGGVVDELGLNSAGYVMQLFPQLVQPIGSNPGEAAALAKWAGKTVHAVAAIGRPARFFEMLRDYGIVVIEHGFADHHVFAQNELEFGDQQAIFMTSKDAVKCRRFNLGNCWEVVVQAHLGNGFDEWILEKLTHGPKNA